MLPRSCALAVLVGLFLSGCLGTEHADDPVSEPPLLVCPEPCLRPVLTSDGWSWETHVAVDPEDPAHIVATSHDERGDRLARSYGWILVHVTFDGGATWETSRLPGGFSADPTHPLYRYQKTGDATVMFLTDGTVLVSGAAITAEGRSGTATVISGFTLFVARSTDGGRTFPDISIVQEGGGFWVTGPQPVSRPTAVALDIQDKQWFARLPDGSVLLVWTRNEENDARCIGQCTETVFSVSKDRGATWSAPRVIYGGVSSGAFPLVRADGGWVVSFRATNAREAWVAVSTDEGASWDIVESIDDSTKFPWLTATDGPAGERIWMVYPASASGDHDDPQTVKLRWSDDGGYGWSEALVLANSTRPGRTIPAVAPAPDGGVYVTYWLPDEEGAELRAVVVRDDAVSPPLVLDTHDGSTSWTGDYMGLDVMPDGSAFAVWNARQDDGFVVNGARLVG